MVPWWALAASLAVLAVVAMFALALYVGAMFRDRERVYNDVTIALDKVALEKALAVLVLYSGGAAVEATRAARAALARHRDP